MISLLALSISGCAASPEEVAQLAYEAAVASDLAGDMGASEQLLVELLEGEPAPVTAAAERLLEDIRVRQEGAVIQAIHDINQAQADFMTRERRYAQFFDALVEGAFLATSPENLGLGWVLRMRPSPAADSYALTAEPELGAANKRFFFSDETGVIRWETGASATVESPELAP